MQLNDWKGVGVFIEQDEATAEEISWELMGKARDLADKSKQNVIAFILGSNIQGLAEEAISRGADVAIIADHHLLEHYKWETYSKVTAEMIEAYKPSSMIFGATPNGRDLAGRLAVKLKAGLTADVVELDIQEDGLLLGSVPGFGGSILAVIKCETSRPQMATVRPGIFNAQALDYDRKGEISKFNVKLDKAEITTHLIKKIKIEIEDISKAKKIVAAGRGIGGDLTKVKELSDLLSASIGVTRPLCDDGILPRNHQIGSTGVTVKPNLTLVLGISGAMHFTSGIKESETIVAINTDKDAIIFDYADYGIVGDVNKILPMLIEKIKAKLLQEVK